MNDGELSKRIDDVHRRLDDLRADVVGRIDALRAEMTARFSAADKRFDDLTTRIAGIEDRLWWIVGIQVGTWITVMLALLFRR